MTFPHAFMMSDYNGVSYEYPEYPVIKNEDTHSSPTLATVSGTECPVYPVCPVFFL